MSTQLAKKLIEQRRQKANELIGTTIKADMHIKAISIDEKEHTAIFVMSTSGEDRHEEVVDQDSWNLEHFLKNPAFFLQHASWQFPIGKWLEVWLEADPDRPGKQRLVGKAEFRVEFEDAARAFTHVVKGDMNMVSVGFIPKRILYDEDNDIFVLMDCELLECSLVGIGSNRDALVKSAEEKKAVLIEAKEILEETVELSEAGKKAIAVYKAQELFNKAIRNLKK